MWENREHFCITILSGSPTPGIARAATRQGWLGQKEREGSREAARDANWMCPLLPAPPAQRQRPESGGRRGGRASGRVLPCKAGSSAGTPPAPPASPEPGSGGPTGGEGRPQGPSRPTFPDSLGSMALLSVARADPATASRPPPPPAAQPEGAAAATALGTRPREGRAPQRLGGGSAPAARSGSQGLAGAPASCRVTRFTAAACPRPGASREAWSGLARRLSRRPLAPGMRGSDWTPSRSLSVLPAFVAGNGLATLSPGSAVRATCSAWATRVPVLAPVSFAFSGPVSSLKVRNFSSSGRAMLLLTFV